MSCSLPTSSRLWFLVSVFPDSSFYVSASGTSHVLKFMLRFVFPAVCYPVCLSVFSFLCLCLRLYACDSVSEGTWKRPPVVLVTLHLPGKQMNPLISSSDSPESHWGPLLRRESRYALIKGTMCGGMEVAGPAPSIRSDLAVRERQETDADRRRQTETDKDKQRQTETDRDRRRQTETKTDKRDQQTIGIIELASVWALFTFDSLSKAPNPTQILFCL